MIQAIKNIFFPSSQKQEADTLLNNAKIKVCVVDFVDNVESNNASILCSQLQMFDNLEVIYYKEPFSKTFLNLEVKNLFDFIDTGLDILYKTKADVLVWGYREGESLRLNFQNEQMFNADNSTFVSILDSLYIPSVEDGFSSSVINLIYGAVVAALCPADNELKIIKKYWLKKVIASLSKDNSAKDLPANYLPYVMNFLGLIYLSYSSYNMNEKDFKITSSLFENALNYQDLIKNPLHLGRIYTHLAELNDVTSLSSKVRPFKFFASAVENYRLAQKYLNKYNFPYDYGCICYRLSTIFFAIFKQKNEVQSLRDSVFQLREAEKIFTYALFPDFWGNIQGDLGYKLALLGSLSNSEEISELAIGAYKNQQKIISERTDAIEWARIQDKIGQIYYQLGKKSQDKALLEAALECFHDALYIFENAGLQEHIKTINISILKASSI